MLRLERNPGRMLAEVAEEKKAWKKEKTTFMNISVNENMVESTLGIVVVHAVLWKF